MKLTYFVVVRGTGVLKQQRRGHPPRLYRTKGAAQRYARDPGDSVLAVVVDLDVEPVFIRGQIV